MSSILKSSTARTNGAKSVGPSTPEGKAKSSQNALRHGLYSKAILLPSESPEEFQRHLQDHYDEFLPTSAVEAGLVQVMAIAQWRLGRMLSMEANLINNEQLEKCKWMEKELDHVGEPGRTAWAFRNLTDNSAVMTLLIRYEATVSRSYDRALKQLQLVRKIRRNEPKPAPPPPARPTPKPPPPPLPPFNTPSQPPCATPQTRPQASKRNSLHSQ